MSINELRKIRERRSLETLGMTMEQLNGVFKKGADEMMKIIEKKASRSWEKIAVPPIRGYPDREPVRRCHLEKRLLAQGDRADGYQGGMFKF